MQRVGLAALLVLEYLEGAMGLGSTTFDASDIATPIKLTHLPSTHYGKSSALFEGCAFVRHAAATADAVNKKNVYMRSRDQGQATSHV